MKTNSLAEHEIKAFLKKKKVTKHLQGSGWVGGKSEVPAEGGLKQKVKKSKQDQLAIGC